MQLDAFITCERSSNIQDKECMHYSSTSFKSIFLCECSDSLSGEKPPDHIARGHMQRLGALFFFFFSGTFLQCLGLTGLTHNVTG